MLLVKGLGSVIRRPAGSGNRCVCCMRFERLRASETEQAVTTIMEGRPGRQAGREAGRQASRRTENVTLRGSRQEPQAGKEDTETATRAEQSIAAVLLKEAATQYFVHLPFVDDRRLYLKSAKSAWWD
jgi:hypothetical protein